MTDEELEPFLNGSLGVAALDLARELVGTKSQLGVALERLEASSAEAVRFAAVAEMAIGEAAQTKGRLHELAEALASTTAGIRDFLGADNGNA